MQVEYLGCNPTKPCLILNVHDVRIMLDCPLDDRTLTRFLPQTMPAGEGHTVRKRRREDGVIHSNSRCWLVPEYEAHDAAAIDVVLISNASAMLALPLLAKCEGFRARVFCTEPTYWIAKDLMQELVTLCHSNASTTSRSNKRDDLYETQPMMAWERPYSQADLDAALATVTIVSYDQPEVVVNEWSARAVSAGYCLGSANWIISSGAQLELAWLGASAWPKVPEWACQSFQLAPLQRCRVMLLTGVPSGGTAPQPFEDRMRDIVSRTVEAIGKGGNVLFPVQPAGGCLFEMIEVLWAGLQASGRCVPMYFVSPVASEAVSYSRLSTEWLDPTRQERTQNGELPYGVCDLVNSGALKLFKRAGDRELAKVYKEPCIVFASHPSMRFGASAFFMKQWKAQSNSLVVLTESVYGVGEVLGDFGNISMGVLSCPIECRLTSKQAVGLVQQVQPEHLALPREYLQQGLLEPLKTELTQQLNCHQLVPYRATDIPIEQPSRKAFVATQLANTLTIPACSQEHRKSLVRVSAKMDIKDDRITLDAHNSKSKSGNVPYPILYGNAAPRAVLDALSQAGICDAIVRKASSSRQVQEGISCVLEIESLGVTISLGHNQTHIESASESSRARVSDVVMSCLQSC